MNVKEAIEILKDENRDICYGTTLADEATKLAVEIMERTRWIPVSERLPAPFQGVLISNGQWVEFALWGCGEIADTKNYQLCKSATHWMLLPESPEVE